MRSEDPDPCPFSRVPSDRGAPLFNLSQREAEGERSPSHAKSRPALAESRHESAAEGEAARSPACLPACHATPGLAGGARAWHALVHFLTSQVKWNKSHHISQGKRPLDFQCGTIGILHHYTP
jgi:hypothetical protein